MEHVHTTPGSAALASRIQSAHPPTSALSLPTPRSSKTKALARYRRTPTPFPTPTAANSPPPARATRPPSARAKFSNARAAEGWGPADRRRDRPFRPDGLQEGRCPEHHQQPPQGSPLLFRLPFISASSPGRRDREGGNARVFFWVQEPAGFSSVSKKDRLFLLGMLVLQLAMAFLPRFQKPIWELMLILVRVIIYCVSLS